MPVDNGICSATVITSDCVTADAYATAIMSVENDKLEELLQTEPPLDYYIICRGKDKSTNYDILQSARMEKYF